MVSQASDTTRALDDAWTATMRPTRRCTRHAATYTITTSLGSTAIANSRSTDEPASAYRVPKNASSSGAHAYSSTAAGVNSANPRRSICRAYAASRGSSPDPATVSDVPKWRATSSSEVPSSQPT
ncbi:hypothetical protein ACFQY4_32220 [Catellatospora bangladeshensis]|uniref:hypothetical protein n=1 Tax=Catellatospora bangladeshensis TaxID=310355 RepID=UPI0036238CC7